MGIGVRVARKAWMAQTRHVTPRRAAVSHPRRNALIATACDLSEEVYHPRKTQEDFFVSDVATDVRVSMGVRVCDSKRYCTVAFCGTESLNDWLYNFMLWTVGQGDGMPGRVHAGYWRKWTSVRTRVVRSLLRLKPKRVLVTGHSLGGALASMACGDIARALPNVSVYSYTFGAPRCADAEFYARDPPPNLVNFVRCVHAGDVIHNFPPLPGYVHPERAQLLVVGRSTCRTRPEPCHRSPVAAHPLLVQLQSLWRFNQHLEHHLMFSYKRAIAMDDIG